MKNVFLLPLALSFGYAASAQVTIQKNAGVYLQPGSIITLQGNLNSQDDILGSGAIHMNGLGLQTLAMHDSQLGELIVDNPQHVSLDGSLHIDNVLTLKQGRLRCYDGNVYLNREAGITEGSETSYIETGESGKLIKAIDKDLTGYFIPIGASSSYTPLAINTRGFYQSGNITIAASNRASDNKPTDADAYINNFWTIQRSGIKGDVAIKAIFGAVNGKEQSLQGYYWNGSSWNRENATLQLNTRSVTVNVPEGNGEIYAMHFGGNDFQALPNPATDLAVVQINSIINEQGILQVFDGMGRVVINKAVSLITGKNQYFLTVRDLSKGHYIIFFTSRSKRVSCFLVKG